MGTEPREELKAKQLEKVIYFAANLVTAVDEEKRHEERPNLEAEFQDEKREITKDMELALARRHEELEKEIEELEKEGAKDADLKNRQKAAEKDLGAHDPRAVRGRGRHAPARLG